jgi:hypothetical protein
MLEDSVVAASAGPEWVGTEADSAGPQLAGAEADGAGGDGAD